jgi:hypothetical protein
MATESESGERTYEEFGGVGLTTRIVTDVSTMFLGEIAAVRAGQLVRGAQLGSARFLPTGGQATVLDANRIRFSQESISFAKARHSDSYVDIVQSMRNDGWLYDPIDVVRMPDGRLTSVDNTRLLAARDAGIPVRARVWDASEALPTSMQGRFDILRQSGDRVAFSTWGQAIARRTMSQSTADWLRLGAGYGTYAPPRITYGPLANMQWPELFR